MLTRKHFNALANILNQSKDKTEIIYKISMFCKDENNNFDIKRFKRACGLEV